MKPALVCLAWAFMPLAWGIDASGMLRPFDETGVRHVVVLPTQEDCDAVREWMNDRAADAPSAWTTRARACQPYSPPAAPGER